MVTIHQRYRRTNGQTTAIPQAHYGARKCSARVA